MWDETVRRATLERVETLPDGRVQIRLPGKTAAQLRATMQSHSPDYTKIRAPALAIYSMFDHYPTKPDGIPIELANRADEYWRNVALPNKRSNIEQFRQAAPDAQIIELANTYHACFGHREDEVYHAILAFLAKQ